ncbi:hypothetical protein NDU88_008246 [Pleurodeles waltl]|uniref:Uncharacterized protein n=1 Tax=Pleurodeles waltl TaxID=8319 RepID=A0AAV7QTZ3_PLEWA|nr:hypothetical protein NDU88_008246 [Pleurodeles waltl]
MGRQSVKGGLEPERALGAQKSAGAARVLRGLREPQWRCKPKRKESMTKVDNEGILGMPLKGKKLGRKAKRRISKRKPKKWTYRGRHYPMLHDSFVAWVALFWALPGSICSVVCSKSFVDRY